MQPTQFSSGDVIADRRADYARMLAESGDPAAAAELMEQALELAPTWAAGWLRLGEYREKAGLDGEAAVALERVLALDPEDIFGASLKLALLGAAETPDKPPSRYVEALFDDYADRFEEVLVERLDYSVPGKLAALVRRVRDEGGAFDCAVDLGCGTGLLGIEIRGMVKRLEGFDLSTNMLAKAEEKGIYDLLARSDLSVDVDLSGVFAGGLARGRADLVAAADVLMYLGDLSNAFALAAALASPAALFAFSVEDAATPDGFHLAPSLRYAHSEHYVRGALAAEGFETLDIERTTIRMDGGKPVFGILFIAIRTA
ncbi:MULTISPECIES: class I SAM-dependent DNA methyltransferase [Alphaproteobacteria]|uniref:Methyltransferase n=2 Tax=Alphaproteobacteria TaxID=28211 RepID=A0A512HDK2_9HYPH|nr:MULTISPECIES: methyltransferase domain-containing protein [Alphaproteobacteria]GEO83534.1 methyltransferase [Ciceribacter naphthalenivorans]GLR24315.1 methyltransferase [Ciceribacter naphthalenivorans]GLT07171.1 methyltransferase [Sphingomonas psychrolutea]